VWHLREDKAGTGTADLYQDSTIFTNHGVDGVSATGKVGIVGNGQQFNPNFPATDHALGTLNLLNRNEIQPQGAAICVPFAPM